MQRPVPGRLLMPSYTAGRCMPTWRRHSRRSKPAARLPTVEHQQTRCATQNRSQPMLYYAVVFFVIALIAALFGFGGIAAGAASIAQILFVVFLVLAIGAFLFNMFRGRT
jgi:uncharacterized membrane protein YtjA (UPF0391 family)